MVWFNQGLMLILLMLVGLAGMTGCASNISPMGYIPTDGLLAERYGDLAYEVRMIDAGVRGYNSLKKDIVSTRDGQILACQLRVLGLFYIQYYAQGGACSDRLYEIWELLHRLLVSSDKSIVRATITSIYYDIDLRDDRAVGLRKAVEVLTNDSDPYVRMFALLSLGYKRSHVANELKELMDLKRSEGVIWADGSSRESRIEPDGEVERGDNPATGTD